MTLLKSIFFSTSAPFSALYICIEKRNKTYFNFSEIKNVDLINAN